MCEIKFKFLPALLVVATVAGAAEITPSMRDTINRADVGRQEVDQQGGALVKAGNELFVEGRYMEARDKYLKAIKVYDNYSSGVFVEYSEYCRKRISDCYFKQAQVAMQKADELAQVKDYDEAIKLCREALKYCGKEQVEELNRQIAIYEKRRDGAVERDSTSSARLMPNRKAQEYQIQVLLEQGRKLSMNREYSRAARKFQEALLINPFNSDALQCLRAVNERISDIGVQRYKNEHRRFMGELEWKMAVPYQPFAEDSAHNLIASGTAKAKLDEKGTALRRRLELIRLPKVYLPETTVADAVEYLRNESAKHDPNKRGVNIVFLRTLRNRKTTTAAAPSAAANDGPTDGPNDGAVGPAAPQQNPENEAEVPAVDERITLEIKDKSLLEVLDMLCGSTKAPKMRYQIDENAVLISPENLELGGMMTKSIQINLPEGTTEAELKNNMIAEGIEFRPGSGIAYFPALGRVVIKNDSKNLGLMEEYFERIRPGEELIQLQIKLVEMSQNDIDELAFNWQYSINSNKAVIGAQANSQGTSSPLNWGGNSEYRAGDATKATIMQKSSNELLRYYVPDKHTGTALSDSTYSFVWANSDGTKITANMFALDWADSQDVLASPRITTVSGQTAKIQMVTIRYFPEEWETIEVDTVVARYGVSITRVTPQPTLDKEKKLGVDFEVKPEVTPDGMIRIPINFPITTFSDEWTIYDNRTDNGSGGSDDGDYIQMPVFNTRKINTTVQLHDGETIVLGGTNIDNKAEVNDKIPILGDIPVIGRLFQSRYSTSQKTSLLIFLTCRLVKPDGTAFYPDKQIERGLPRFGRIY